MKLGVVFVLLAFACTRRREPEHGPRDPTNCATPHDCAAELARASRSKPAPPPPLAPYMPPEPGWPMIPLEQQLAARMVAFGSAALAELEPLLGDPDARVADGASYSIGRFGTAATPLIPALHRALDRGRGWAAHALAATKSPDAIAILKAAAVRGDATAGSLVFMGVAGQRAFVEALAATSKPLSLIMGFDLFLPALRIDASELVKGLSGLATDKTMQPANRGVACTFLVHIGGQALPVVPALRQLARDHVEDIAARCGYAAEQLERIPEMARGSGEGAAIDLDLTRAAPALDATAAAAWTSAVRKTLGDAYVLARVEPRSARSIKAFVTRVSGLGVTPSGYLSLGPGLDWPEEGASGPRLPTAEVFYDLAPEGQHLDGHSHIPECKLMVSRMAAVAAEAFGVRGVAGFLFHGGLTFENEFVPLYVVYIPGEGAARFRWNALDAEILSERLPPEDIGIATSRLKAGWSFARISARGEGGLR